MASGLFFCLKLRAYRTQHNNYKREIEERARCLPRDPTDPNTGFAKVCVCVCVCARACVWFVFDEMVLHVLLVLPCQVIAYYACCTRTRTHTPLHNQQHSMHATRIECCFTSCCTSCFTSCMCCSFCRVRYATRLEWRSLFTYKYKHKHVF